MVDANGVAIAVGETVMITGVVIALNPASTHYREVTIRVIHPVPGVPANDIPTAPDAGGTVNARTEMHMHHPGADYILKVSNLVLNH
jgi:hypothetical protein